MPNNTANILTVVGDNEQRKLFTEQIDGDNGVITFASLRPMPEGKDWYSWNTEHYGTKWEPYEISEWVHNYEENYQQISYQTAWNAPLVFYLFASKLFPELQFEQEYADEGGYFLGGCHIKNGEITKKYDYDWDSLAGITLRKKLGVYDEDEVKDEKEEEELVWPIIMAKVGDKYVVTGAQKGTIKK